jgi:putative transcription factor
MICELCGIEQASLLVDVEGAKLKLCQKCAKFGKPIGKLESAVELKNPFVKKDKPKSAEPEKEVIQIITGDFSSKIKKARESMGLTQEEFAKYISEKASTLHKIETGNFEPSLETARKLERLLKIKLVEQHEEVKAQQSHMQDQSLTIGDYVKVKKR